MLPIDASKLLRKVSYWIRSRQLTSKQRKLFLYYFYCHIYI